MKTRLFTLFLLLVGVALLASANSDALATAQTVKPLTNVPSYVQQSQTAIFFAASRYGTYSPNEVYRYSVAGPNSPAVLEKTITSPGFDSIYGIAFNATGEMYITNVSPSYQNGSIARILDPLNSATPNGTITNPHLTSPSGVIVRDNLMYVAQDTSGDVLVFSIAPDGSATWVNTITDQLTPTRPRGVTINPAGTQLFVTQCCGSNQVLRYALDGQGGATFIDRITGNGLNNPHDMAFSPWGELFVADAFGNSISRFTFDQDGNPVAHGLITGNGLNVPVGLDFSPWGELFVGSHYSPLISRWTFNDDADHTAVANGNFSVPYNLSDIMFDGNSTTTSYSISGEVTDSSTPPRPIPDVTISAGPAISTTTNISGTYTLTGLTAGTYTLTPSKPGYTFSPTSSPPITVPTDATANFTAYLFSDIGFRPYPNGYNFKNTPTVDPHDFTKEDMITMFGIDKVCKSVINGNCQFDPVAEQQYSWILNNLSGLCDGFTITAWRYFLPDLDPLPSGITSTFFIPDSVNARRPIAYFHVEQYFKPTSDAIDEAFKDTPVQVLNKISSALSNEPIQPLALDMRHWTFTFPIGKIDAHSVLPYAVEDQGKGIFLIKVYDNDHPYDPKKPEDSDRGVIVDTNANKWSYDTGNYGVWNGDGNPLAFRHTLAAVDVSAYLAPNSKVEHCPWCNSSSVLQTWFQGPGHLLVTNSQGQRIGFVGDQFISEIPNASVIIPSSDLSVPKEPIYNLPTADTYTILVDGQTLTQTQKVSLAQFGPGYADSVDNVTLAQSSQDQLTIGQSGAQLAYQVNATKPVTLTVALESTGESDQFQVQNADVGANQTVQLTAQTGNGKVAFSNAHASGGKYAAAITRVNSNGQQTFNHMDISIANGDTDYFDYRTWTGAGPMTMEVDHGSNGTIDQTVLLNNQTVPTIEDRDQNIQYNGWHGLIDPNANGGTYRVSNVKNDKATFKLKGTNVTWLTQKGPDQGQASILIDGLVKRTVDLYALTARSNISQTIKGLTNITHTLTIQVLHTKNTKSSGYNVSVDAFQVGKTATQDDSTTVTYGTWGGASNANASGGSYRSSTTKNAIASLTFTGTSVNWITATGKNYGKAQIWIDKVLTDTVDLYSPTPQWQVIKSYAGLSNGTHTIQIKVLGTKNVKSTGYRVVVDAFSGPITTTGTSVQAEPETEDTNNTITE